MIEDIRNYLPLTETLLSSGMPTAEQLRAVAKSGVQVVINLALHTSENALHGEEQIVKSLGMKYINIPVLWDAPTRKSLVAFMDAMDKHKNQKLLVHCQANYRATGFITLYRILRLGWDKEKAFQDLRHIWNPEEYPVWQQFIDQQLAIKS